MTAPAAYNPFDGVSPSLGPFSSVLSSKVGIFLGLVWAIAFIYAAYHLIEGLARIARANRQGGAYQVADVRAELGMAAISVIGLAAVPVLYGILAS
jgi:hypothetical protein